MHNILSSFVELEHDHPNYCKAYKFLEVLSIQLLGPLLRNPYQLSYLNYRKNTEYKSKFMHFDLSLLEGLTTYQLISSI